MAHLRIFGVLALLGFCLPMADAADKGEQEGALNREFVGSVTFEHVLTLEKGTPEFYWQRGKIHRGPEGQLRLDLWLDENQQASITCCVADGRVWMVWGDSALVHYGPYPSEQPEPEGWYSAMLSQAKQARSWGVVLLDQFVPDGRRFSVNSIESEKGRKKALVRIHTDDIAIQGLVEIHFQPGPGRLPAAVDVGGSVYYYLGRDDEPESSRLARQVISSGIECRGHRTQHVWNLTRVEVPPQSKLVEFGKVFDVPAKPTPDHPRLVGSVFYDEMGNPLDAVAWQIQE